MRGPSRIKSVATMVAEVCGFVNILRPASPRGIVWTLGKGSQKNVA